MYVLLWKAKCGEVFTKVFKTWDKADAYRRKHGLNEARIERLKAFA